MHSLGGEERLYDRTRNLKESVKVRWGSLILPIFFIVMYLISNDFNMILYMLVTLPLVFPMFLTHRLAANRFHLDNIVTFICVSTIITSVIVIIIQFIYSDAFGTAITIVLILLNSMIILGMIGILFKYRKKCPI